MFGIAMNGAPKYTPQDTHLDYVNPDAPKGGHIKIAAIGSFDNLNPFSIKGVPAEGLELINDRLMRRVWDEPFTMYPLIAQSIDVPEDRSSITFHLDPRARFHDGSPITADDVQFSFETLRDHGRPNMQRIYKLAKDVKVQDKHTITFTFGEGYNRETVMIFALMPVLSKTWWKDRNFEETLTDIPLGSGPYKIKKSETGRAITYERVHDYWAKDLLANKGQYNFDEITYDYYRDDTIALEAFKKGDLSWRREYDISKWESAYDGLEQSGIVKLEAPHQRPERTHGFIFNMRRAPFDNIDVRKALVLAFDADWIGKNIFYGKVKQIDSIFPNSILADPDRKAPDYPSFRHQLKAAGDLLNRAGWIIQNGQRVNKDTGKPLSFELLVSTPQEEKVALTYKQSLAKLGVDMTIRRLDSATFTERKMSYAYDVIAMYWQNSLSPGTEQMVYWSCDAAHKKGSFNYAGICDPAVDKLAASIASATTYDDLKTIAHKLDHILMAKYFFVPLFYKGADYIALQNSIAHPDKTPIYGIVTESWWQKSAKNQPQNK